MFLILVVGRAPVPQDDHGAGVPHCRDDGLPHRRGHRQEGKARNHEPNLNWRHQDLSWLPHRPFNSLSRGVVFATLIVTRMSTLLPIVTTVKTHIVLDLPLINDTGPPGRICWNSLLFFFVKKLILTQYLIL